MMDQAARQFVREVVDKPGKNLRPKTAPIVFEGTWADAGSIAPAYFRSMDGMVHLQGQVTGGGAALITTLPDGFRPAGEQHFAVPSNALFGVVRVLVDGSVEAVVGGFTNVFLDGVSYRVA